MKAIAVCIVLISTVDFASAQYQETTKDWRVVPELMLVRYLPGQDFSSDNYSWDGSNVGYQYSGFGGSLRVRFMNTNFPGLALTLSGGATSFYRPDRSVAVPYAASLPGMKTFGASTLGGDERLGDFFVFPLALGVQGLWPFRNMEKFRLFAGAEAAAYFVDGSVSPHAQTRFGYTVDGGFGVGIVELGARYSRFADMSNIGVFLGLCMKFYEF
ncbi:MAG: hypothetical protein WB699_12730 [Bacteroidota bacterium]